MEHVHMEKHLLFRQNVRDVELKQLQKQFAGAKYNKLVQKHIRKLGYETIKKSVYATVCAFDDTERQAAEQLVDEYNELGYDRDFWRSDCAEVFSRICARFTELVLATNHLVENKMKINAFQLVTLNFAQMLLEQKAARKFAGIKKSLFFR